MSFLKKNDISTAAEVVGDWSAIVTFLVVTHHHLPLSLITDN